MENNTMSSAEAAAEIHESVIPFLRAQRAYKRGETDDILAAIDVALAELNVFLDKSGAGQPAAPPPPPSLPAPPPVLLTAAPPLPAAAEVKALTATAQSNKQKVARKKQNDADSKMTWRLPGRGQTFMF